MDLNQSSFEFSVVSGADPDGDGPVEASLASPYAMAMDQHALAAINTNAWSMIPDPKTGKTPGHVRGGHADIKGWVVADGKQISPPERAYCSCWMDLQGVCHIADVAIPGAITPSATETRWAISGFGAIVEDRKILVEPNDVLHPRTSIGVSNDGRRMTWLVVDGRQPGISEGVSEYELAQLMLESEVDDCINLDGGGSSILVLEAPDGKRKAANRPSDFLGARPLPVVLSVRSASQSK
jgi:exopolysaccharide biosynthesis protein